MVKIITFNAYKLYVIATPHLILTKTPHVKCVQDAEVDEWLRFGMLYKKWFEERCSLFARSQRALNHSFNLID
jgi:hypothetical protein